MKKRLISILLTLCLALALLPGTAWAVASGTCGDNLTWTLTDDGRLTISGTGAMTNYYSENNSRAPWDSQRNAITALVIGSGVTSIGVYAFSGCTNLTSVTIPDSVTSIEYCGFLNCSSLTSVTIPGSVTSIGEMAFDGCSGLTSVIIPDGVTSIREGTFQRCSSLTGVTIPDSVTTIEKSAFTGCSSLSSVTIPGSVTSIERYAFSNCESLTSVAIPGSVTSIGTGTFDGCSSLNSVTIGDGVTTIEFGVFQKCSNLTSVTIPDSVTTIEMYAFYMCKSLSDVYYGGSKSKWEKITINEFENDPLLNATIHFNSTGPNSGVNNATEYIYETTDPGADTKLDTERLNKVTDPATAASAVQAQTQSMTTEQKESATGADLATLYAETAVAKAASKSVSGNEITINAAAVADLETEAAQAVTAVETALVSGGVTTARLISSTVTLTTDETGEISIRIAPDILTTKVDKIRVETPTYALTLKVSELEPDLTGIITITARDVGTGYAPGDQNKKTTVQVNLPQGKTTNPVTVSLPKDGGDTTYQAVVKTDGTSTSSKYNPATTTMDGKITTSGNYTVQTKQKDFTDIANKSAEMQSAIRYLASKGIINGDTDTTFSPDASISRAEIAALIVRALGKLDSSATNSFTDVTTANWYYSAAGSSQRLGIITGYEDNTFRGTTAINKEQIVAVAARVLISEMNYKTPGDTATYLSKYSDTVVTWAQPQVALATKENLVVYRTDGTFSGARNMTRGDAAIIIYRLFQKIW